VLAPLPIVRTPIFRIKGLTGLLKIMLKKSRKSLNQVNQGADKGQDA